MFGARSPLFGHWTATCICSVRSSASFDLGKVGSQLLSAYAVLGLQQNCSKDQLKERYVQLIKRFHPDTGGASADSLKFQRVQDAYKLIAQHDYSENEREELLEEVQRFWDIRHTAPQHRQYLEYGGIGVGTPSQRLKQYQQSRVQQAQSAVHEFMVQKIATQTEQSAIVIKQREEARFAKKQKTGMGIERLVEDLILESMKNGQFDKLSGSGKPLRYSTHNPFLDSTTHKLNEILIQEGFSPEWIMKEKELKQEQRAIRKLLCERRAALDADSDRWSEKELLKWNKTLKDTQNRIAALNKQISNYNLIVPALSRQMFHLNADKELKRAVEAADKLRKSKSDETEKRNKPETVLSSTEATSVQFEEKRGILRTLLAALQNINK